MTDSRHVLAILAYDSGAAPSMTEFADVIRDQRYSLARYWQDNAAGVVSIDRLDLVGPYLITPPAFTRDAQKNPVSPGRVDTVNAARAAAQQAGVDLSPYDATFVVLSPGFVVIDGTKVPYDGGTDPSETMSLVMITDPLSIFQHEMGHLFHFEHSQGALTGKTSSGNPKWDYGDPYDIMSAMTFGDANPVMTIVGTPTATYTASATVGPMLSRAELYRVKREHVDPLGTVLHASEGGNTSAVLFPAGTGAPGRPELLVYTTNQGGEIYVEFRKPGAESERNWWDGGLVDPAQGGTGNVPAALVVHYPALNASGNPASWFAGRITFPDPDRDTTFATPDGVFTVTVSDAQRSVPDSVSFTISRGRPAHPSVQAYEDTSTKVTVLASEKRINPRYPDAGPFTWERRSITRTTTYTPRVIGVGVNWASPITAHSDIEVRWTFDDGGGPLPAGVMTLHNGMRCTVAADTGVLTVTNDPTAGHVSATLTATAVDKSIGAGSAPPGTTQVQFDVTSPVEGWGTDFLLFLLRRVRDLLDRKWGLKLGPIEIGPVLEHLDELRRLNVDLNAVALDHAHLVEGVGRGLDGRLDASAPSP